MKNKWIVAAFAAIMALLAAGCNNGIGGDSVAMEYLDIDRHELKLVPRETRKLTVTVLPSNAIDKMVTWSSSDASVATVSNDGRVTATQKGGLAIITARLGDKEAICGLRVCSHVYLDEGDKCDECGFPKPVLEGGEISYSSVWAYLMYVPVTLKKYDGDAAEVNIPEGVMEIESRAFEDCTSLVSVKIPDGVTKIGSYAFQGCTNLASVTIPDSVTSFDIYTFQDCTKLKEIKFGGTMAQWNAIKYNDYCTMIPGIQCSDGYIGVKNAPEYLKISRTEDTVAVTGYADGLPANLVIPDGVTSIGYEAFKGCTNLASVEIPDGVTSIGSEAFYGCTSLASVTIPDGVTSIESWAFEGCASLASVEIPDTVTSIGQYSFSGCASLASVTIPDSVTSIGYKVFSSCSSLASVEIPDSVTSIGEGAFSSCSSLASVKIPDSVTSIGISAFSSCNGLMSVEIPASVTSIEGWAFGYCTSLESVTIPNGVTKIGDGAFRGCTGLTSVAIPASVTSIGGSAFELCKNLTAINYTGTEEQWNAITKGGYWDYKTGSYTITYNYKE